MPIIGAAADWRRPEPYARLLRCDRSLFAWEWLRRDPAYRRALSQGKGSDAARFGLLRFEPAQHGVPVARPFWRSDADKAVLRAAALATADPRDFDVSRLHNLATLWRSATGEHLLLCDGCQAVRLDILSGTLAAGPVRLDWCLQGLEGLGLQLDALARLMTCHRRGGFGAPTLPTRARARRWATLLRVQDALIDGATARAIAEALFGGNLAGQRWRVEAASARARVQRLMAAARRLGASGPAAILRAS
jgi:hypothetical protein